MKKISLISILLITMVIPGCKFAGLQITNNDVADVAVKIAARRVGSLFAQQTPGSVDIAKAICDGLQQSEDGDLTPLIGQAADKIDDPLLRADIQDLMDLISIKVDGGEGTEIHFLRISIDAFRQGLDLGELK